MPKAKVLSRRTIFRGKVFSVTTERVREPNGITAQRDVIHHPGSVVILAVDHKKRVLLERQYRHPAGKYLWELPAGRIDPGESPLAAAKRELLEETGYTARRWLHLLCYYASPGFLSETMAVYLAEQLTAGRARPEADESIHTRFFALGRWPAPPPPASSRTAKPSRPSSPTPRNASPCRSLSSSTLSFVLCAFSSGLTPRLSAFPLYFRPFQRVNYIDNARPTRR